MWPPYLSLGPIRAFQWTRWRIFALLCASIALWVVALTWMQNGWAGLARLGSPLLIVLCLLLVLYDVIERLREPTFLLLQVPVLLGAAFSSLSGDDLRITMIFNIAAIAGGMWAFYALFWSVAAVIQAVGGHKLHFRTPGYLGLFVGCLLAGWISVSIAWGSRFQALPIDPERFEKPAMPTISLEHAQQLRVGLSLSGGGYRAATFHAGVVRALESIGVRPAIISSVSGGSIFAAYYVHGGDPSDFKNAVAQGRFSLRRQVLLIQNASRLVFPFTIPYVETELFPWYRFNRRDVQAELIQNTLLGNVNPNRALTTHQPTLAIAATDLVRGGVLGRVPNGYIEIDTAGHRRFFDNSFTKVEPKVSFAEWVAISGAFPVAFPPAQLVVHVDWPADFADAGRSSVFRVVLVDGGVIDNRGELLLSAASESACVIRNTLTAPCIVEESAIDLTLSSDAGAVFDEQHDLGGIGILDRAFDVGTIRARKASALAAVSFSVQSFVSDKSFMTGISHSIVENILPGYNQHWVGHLNEYPDDVIQAMVLLWPEGRSLIRARNARLGNRCAAVAAGPEMSACPFTAAERGEAAQLILVGIASDIRAFRTLSTLNDQPSSEDVDRMYRLGQVLVYLNWPELERAAAEAHTHKR